MKMKMNIKAKWCNVWRWSAVSAMSMGAPALALGILGQMVGPRSDVLCRVFHFFQFQNWRAGTSYALYGALAPFIAQGVFTGNHLLLPFIDANAVVLLAGVPAALVGSKVLTDLVQSVCPRHFLPVTWQGLILCFNLLAYAGHTVLMRRLPG